MLLTIKISSHPYFIILINLVKTKLINQSSLYMIIMEI